ncbi:HNH endonuclease [Prauserella sp. PE36]|uniref:HNH endonuclease n=1 Tax=Prauserella endophytica TaxID=1592324 RepID=A0ABY2S0E1_9PSEU|nr:MULTISPECIES: HNH endonuclease family protein [Prauserella]PXY17101.1 hypothetical protein BAY59_36625 [Prauserella coralliicola]RBM21327.1 HNH endonuclease [Prauserella sp. PE36]TKG67541.1 HNH endonuclease [Prauserella endophytica]
MKTPALVVALAAAFTLTACELPEAPAETPAPSGALPQLRVAPEDTGARYDRDDWPHWDYLGDGCDVRDQILQDQGRSVRVGDNCEVTGEWTSVYDGEIVTDAGDLDIDHIVPLAEVARSGSRDWTEAEREAYANDPEVLVAVTARSNRQKGDQDPATWLPDQDRCGYVTRWVQTKAKYDLTADQAEAEAINAILSHCPS